VQSRYLPGGSIERSSVPCGCRPARRRPVVGANDPSAVGQGRRHAGQFVSRRLLQSRPDPRRGDICCASPRSASIAAFINGEARRQRPADARLDDLRHAPVSYQTYAVVRPARSQATNRIEIWLADGWMRSQLMWGQGAALQHCGATRSPRIAELRAMTPVDRQRRSSCDDWESGELPVRKSGIYFGEDYDARFEPKPPRLGTEAIAVRLQLDPHRARDDPGARTRPPLRVSAPGHDAEGRMPSTISARTIAGYVRLRRAAALPVATVLVEHAEVLDETGNRSTTATTAPPKHAVHYTLSGKGEEHFRPACSPSRVTATPASR
jgi:hypothetical protein